MGYHAELLRDYEMRRARLWGTDPLTIRKRTIREHMEGFRKRASVLVELHSRRPHSPLFVRYPALPRPKPAPITPGQTLALLAEETCGEHAIEMAPMLSGRRFHELVVARQDFFYRAAKMGHRVSRIARFCGMDHTTVLHGIRRHCERNGLPNPGEAS